MKYNKHIHSDSKKWRGFRYAPTAPLFTAGDVKRYKSKEDMSLPREQLAKVRTPFRVLAGFIFVLSLFAVLATVTFAFTEPNDHIIWLLGMVTFGMSYISGHVCLQVMPLKFYCLRMVLKVTYNRVAGGL